MDSESGPCIYFEETKFNPFNTFFEGIEYNDSAGKDEKNTEIETPIVIFRYCQLKDIYFSHNSMSIFSFFKCPFFEEAHFVSNTWEKRKGRKYLIMEDLYFEKLGVSPEIKSAEGIEFPLEYIDISELYRRMKTASDRNKDYHLAGWFYFNEFEMKKFHHKRKIKKYGSKTINMLRCVFSGRLWAYSIYKTVAGYGEQPLKSFCFLLLFTIIFAALHLLNGFNMPDGTNINYILNLNFNDFSVSDFINAFLFSLYHIIPGNYLALVETGFGSSGSDPWNILLNLSNTVVLIILVVFIGVGLKRHFRRF